MNKQIVVLVNGRPATGKTTLGKKIASQLEVPFVCRDDIKELLFDNISVGDREWSRKLGKASFVLMYYTVEKFLQSGKSFAIETVFTKEFAESKWKELLDKYSFELCQVFCTTDNEIRKQRFIERNESGECHPGHFDRANYDSEASDELLPLDCSSRLVEVNTDNFKNVDVDKIVRQVLAK